MWDWRQFLYLLADDIQDVADPAAGNGAANGGGGIMPLLIMFGPILLIFLVVNAMLGGPDRKEKKRREELLGTLKKNDQIITIGGIFGTVVSVSEDKSAVTVRVDDNTSAKIKIRLDAIREVVSRPGEETSKES
jgi:preprotein translocase subunit YajC